MPMTNNVNTVLDVCIFACLQIKDELNNPTIEVLKNFKHRGHWECCISDVAGYMFRVCACLAYEKKLVSLFHKKWHRCLL